MLNLSAEVGGSKAPLTRYNSVYPERWPQAALQSNGRTNINRSQEDLETAGILRRRHTSKYLTVHNAILKYIKTQIPVETVTCDVTDYIMETLW
jgi:hypothetical protein